MHENARESTRLEGAAISKVHHRPNPQDVHNLIHDNERRSSGDGRARQPFRQPRLKARLGTSRRHALRHGPAHASQGHRRPRLGQALGGTLDVGVTGDQFRMVARVHPGEVDAPSLRIRALEGHAVRVPGLLTVNLGYE